MRPLWPPPTMIASKFGWCPLLLLMPGTLRNPDLVVNCTKLYSAAAMTVATDSPFTAEELEPTLRPLHEASLLPARAYTDEAVAEWEERNFFLGGWICVGHVSALAGRGDFLTAEIGRREPAVRRRQGLLQRLPPPRRAAGHRARGHQAPAPVPLPRLELRLRRHAQERAAHRRADRLRPGLQRPARDPHRDGRRPRVRRRVRPGAAARGPHRRRSPSTWTRTATPSSSAPPGSTTTSRRTGRPSSRTTRSACTARACTRSSTGSATT